MWLSLLWKFKEVAVVGILMLVVWFGWIDYQNTKEENKILEKNNELLLENKEQNEKLRDKFDSLVTSLAEKDKLDEEKTNEIINRFKDTPDSDLDSGVNGIFVR